MDADDTSFIIASTLNTDEASGTALRLFPKEVYAHSTPGEHELFTIFPPRRQAGLLDRDGFLILMPENTVGRIPLETRNSRENWTPPRLRKNPGQIPFRDAFIQEFPVKSFGPRNKRRHRSTIQGNLVRVENLYADIYPEDQLQPGRSEWPTEAEIQAVIKRERRSTRRATIAERARQEGVEPLDYLTRNVEAYLEAQGYDVASGASPSALALAIAIRARIEGADEPEEGVEALAQINDDWIDDADVARLGPGRDGPGHVAIGTQKTWNPRRGTWEYMITGHLSYDVLDVLGRDKPYVHPFPYEGKNRRADAGFQLFHENDQRRHHLLSGHPDNPLLTPKPIMRFSFKAEEWGVKPAEITEHRPRIITPYVIDDAGAALIGVPEIRTYLRDGTLPDGAFTARRRHYAPPSDTRASKPRPEGLKTFRPDSPGDHDVEPGLTLDDVIDETGLDQIVHGAITARPLVQAVAADDAQPDASAPAEESSPIEENATNPAAPGEELKFPDMGNFEGLEAYIRSRENPSGLFASGIHEESSHDTAEPVTGQDIHDKPQDHQTASDPVVTSDAEGTTDSPANEPEPEATPTPTGPPARPIIQKRIGPGGKVQFGVAAGPPAPAKASAYPYGRILAVADAFLAQRQEQMRHVVTSGASVERIIAFADATHRLALTLIEPIDDCTPGTEARTIRDVLARLALSASVNPLGYADHWLKTTQSLRDLIAPHLR